MNFNQLSLILSVGASVCLLSACDSKPEQEQSPVSATAAQQPLLEVLPYLDVQEQPLVQELPQCQKKQCVDFDIQTIRTQDAWLNEWIAQQQAVVVLEQIGMSDQMSLAKALQAYAQKSQKWQKEFDQNPAYSLHMQSKIASQRNQYILLQLSVSSEQGDTKISQRQYFTVADRGLKRSVKLPEIIEVKKMTQLDDWVQTEYRKWLKKQSKVVRASSRKRLDWQTADWFFDQEGVGLHYRMNQIAMDAEPLDIYLSRQQTQQVLKPDIYQAMF